MPLEYSLDALHGISYKKGCYVGQERVSFGHYRGIIRRRCMPFLVAGPGAEGEGDTRLRAEHSRSVCYKSLGALQVCNASCLTHSRELLLTLPGLAAEVC